MKKIVLTLLLSSVVVFSGCLGAAVLGGAVAGVMIYSYVNNELERKYPKDFETTWQATMKAMEQLQFEIEPGKANKDAITGKIEAHMANGTSVWVNLRMEPKIEDTDVTSVRVRVGSEGDKTVSQYVHDRIKQNLKVPE